MDRKLLEIRKSKGDEYIISCTKEYDIQTYQNHKPQYGTLQSKFINGSIVNTQATFESKVSKQDLSDTILKYLGSGETTYQDSISNPG